MWNYMGWDNLSTIAGEVERPQRTYPLRDVRRGASSSKLSYLLPVAAVAARAHRPERLDNRRMGGRRPRPRRTRAGHGRHRRGSDWRSRHVRRADALASRASLR